MSKADRQYLVYVHQTLERSHVVRASSKKAARQVILDMTLGRVESDDPRILNSLTTGGVGEEKVSTVVERYN